MDPLERYIRSMTTDEAPLMTDLERATHQRAVHPQMLSGHVQGRFLEMIVRMLRPRRILEIGTFTGYSALSMAAGLEPDGVIDTIEADDEQEDFIRSFFDRSPYGDRIRLHIGSALQVAPTLPYTYDLVFIDGDKREYPAYYEMLMGDGAYSRPLVHSGSFLLADNILWYGKVADPERHTDPHTKAILAFNRMVYDDPRTENVILPLRDGLNLIRVL